MVKKTLREVFYENLHIHEKGFENASSMMCLDENSKDFGVSLNIYNLPEIADLIGPYLMFSCVVYSTKESKYYKDQSILGRIKLWSNLVKSLIHEDGTVDLLISNFFTPEQFGTELVVKSYRILKRACTENSKEQQEALEAMYDVVKNLARGLVNGGFHTPNHRWVTTSSIYLAYNILKDEDKDPALLERAQAYLNEKIDLDSEGEWSERSAGMYSAHCDRAFVNIAAETGNLDYLIPVKKNLVLVYKFVENDSYIFTQNSRRKDKGEVSSSKMFEYIAWYSDILLKAYMISKDTDYLDLYFKISNKVPYNSVRPCRDVTIFEYPEIVNVVYEPKDNPLFPDEFIYYNKKSNIVRAKVEDTYYSLMARNPHFLNITNGYITLTARICSSFFAIAQFDPDSIEEVSKGKYHMEQHMHADYKLPLKNPPENSNDYWSLDYKSRESVCPCDYHYNVDVEFNNNSIDIHVKADGTDKVPFKIEFLIGQSSRLNEYGEHEVQPIYGSIGGALIPAKAGSYVCVNDTITLFDRIGDSIQIDGGFSTHLYHDSMRGSLPAPQDKFVVYMTGQSPIDKTIHIECKQKQYWNAFKYVK